MGSRTAALVEVLRIRDFTLLWAAHLISVLGDWVLLSALLVFVYRLTGTKSDIGLMLIAEALPIILFGYVAGALLDYWNRRKVMIAADLVRAGAVLLIMLVDSPARLWIVYLVAFITGTCSLVFRPARAASIPKIVPERILVSANSLSSLNETVGMLIGPVIGGMLAMRYMKIVCLADAATFLFSAAVIKAAVIPQDVGPVSLRTFADLKAEVAHGFRFIAGNRTLRSLFLVIGMGVLGLGAYNVLEVAFATDELGLSGAQFGMLLSSMAFGMLLGSLVTAVFGTRIRPPIMFTGALLGFGVALAAFSRASGFVEAVAAVALAGVGGAVMNVASITIFQLATPNSLQGRIMMLFWIVYTALTLGSMGIAGPAADWLGVRTVLFIVGVIAVGSGFLCISLLCRPDRVLAPVEGKESLEVAAVPDSTQGGD